MIFKAIEFAARAHGGHYRKGTRIPYIVHPLGVARVLIDHGCPEPVVVAGVLHDTLEDTPATLADLRELFGDEVADLVDAVSEPNRSDYTWENGKLYAIRRLKTAPPEHLLLSMADKIDNVRAMREDHERIGDQLWRRFRRPKEKQKWYYESLLEVFSERLTDARDLPLVDLLRAEVNRVFG